MAKLSICMLLMTFLFSTLCIFSSSVTATFPRSPRRSRLQAYIEESCQTTLYPALCVHSLSTYIGSNTTIQNPKQLAQVALKASLNRALYTRAYLKKVANELKAIKAKEYQTVKDCLEQINDSVDQLSQSIKELRRLDGKEQQGAGGGGDDLFWHISNVETWVSAALTDASSCVDEFPGQRMSKLKATVKGKVLNVAQLTSNALALFRRFASRYQAKKP
ncbi:hypothetical protein FEM48_Zijuj08G0054200 [Ziziphus jujuba var. spinosa]|uniref:Pectinesterase inhibitor domain-containing protein n=1 Tax=Ziziphus jujuba var. spinosa TaxID=714518 RepID=A0A978UX85_ZIZJJ|nr:hypothetical protein FEM48_Zijuj08G0054200 [Ziziphus jujuba var. spinosa]